MVFNEVKTLGTQKCRGAAPNFIIIPNKINIPNDVLLSDIIALLKIIIEPTLWIIKYIIAGFLLLSSFITVGTNLIKFNSKPNQIKGQELIDKTAKDPNTTPISTHFNENKVCYL